MMSPPLRHLFRVVCRCLAVSDRLKISKTSGPNAWLSRIPAPASHVIYGDCSNFAVSIFI